MYATYYGNPGEHVQETPAQKSLAAPWTRVRVANMLLLIGLAVMAVAYLVMINKSATKGFTIRSVEQRIASLEEERKNLDLDSLASRSMGSIESQIGDLGLVPVTNVEFLSGAVGPFAAR